MLTSLCLREVPFHSKRIPCVQTEPIYSHTLAAKYAANVALAKRNERINGKLREENEQNEEDEKAINIIFIVNVQQVIIRNTLDCVDCVRYEHTDRVDPQSILVRLHFTWLTIYIT